MTPALKTKNLRLYSSCHRTIDVERHIEWLNNKEVVSFSEQRHRKHNQATQYAYIRSFDQVNSHLWEISRLTNGYDQPIGTITCHLDQKNKVANLGILIGEMDCRGKGYGTEAWIAVCDWLPINGARKIEAGCMANNTAMLRIFKASSMNIEGTKVSHFAWNGLRIDMVMAGRCI